MDGVIAYVEELYDLGLGELFARAFAAALRVRWLAGGLNKQNNQIVTREARRVDEGG